VCRRGERRNIAPAVREALIKAGHPDGLAY